MKLNRRGFLTVTALTRVVGAVAPSAKASNLPDPPQKARLRLSCQEGVPPGKTLAEKLDFMEGLEFEGLELGRRDLPKRVEEIQKAWDGRKIIGYQDFVSFECGCKGDRTKALPAAVKLLREQWDMAAS